MPGQDYETELSSCDFRANWLERTSSFYYIERSSDLRGPGLAGGLEVHR